METKRLTTPVQVKALDDETGTATFVASVFGNVDSSKDRVFKGFFEKSLQERMPKFVADHKWEVSHRLGKVLEARETDEGLEVKVQFNLEKQLAREVYSDFKFAPDDQEFSFGYSVSNWRPNEFGGRDLLEGTVYEVSPVLLGDNPKTRLVGVNGAEEEHEACEDEACEKCRGLNRRRKDDEEAAEEHEEAAQEEESSDDGTISAAVAATRSRISSMLDQIESLLKS